MTPISCFGTTLGARSANGNVRVALQSCRTKAVVLSPAAIDESVDARTKMYGYKLECDVQSLRVYDSDGAALFPTSVLGTCIVIVPGLKWFRLNLQSTKTNDEFDTKIELRLAECEKALKSNCLERKALLKDLLSSPEKTSKP